MNTPLLYLASGSPRRREILESLGYLIKRLTADIDGDGGYWIHVSFLDIARRSGTTCRCG